MVVVIVRMIDVCGLIVVGIVSGFLFVFVIVLVTKVKRSGRDYLKEVI